MSIEQITPAELEQPTFDYPIGDANLEDSIILVPAYGSRQEVDTFWAGEYAKTNLVDQQVQPQKTYDEYVVDAKAALETAIQTEKTAGLDETAPLYREAGFQFLGALGSRPLVEGTNDIGEADPIMLLQYATCLSKQTQSNNVAPYTSEESRHFDRKADLERIASKTFRRAWGGIVGQVDVSDEVIPPVAIASEERLEVAFEEARQVLSADELARV